MTKVIAKIRKARDLAAAWSGIEAAGNGHVHAHLLVVLAPGQTRPDFDAMIRSAGFDEIADSRPADPSAVVEVVKYSLKTPRFEKQINASGQRQPHPDFAAHWALATRSMRLVERYGMARQVETLDTENQTETTVEEITPCPCCGSVSLLDRWQITGVAEAVASWAARTWHGSPDRRLTGERWPKGADRWTAIQLAIPLSKVSGNVAVVVDNGPKPSNTPSWMY